MIRRADLRRPSPNVAFPGPGRVAAIEVEALFTGKNDARDVYLSIHAGAGGVDAMDWAQMLERMYLRWLQRRGYEAEVIDEQEGEEAGLKRAVIEVRGPYARTGGRSEYRNGTEERTLGTSLGNTKFNKPRGRIWKADGKEQEFQSQLLPRYQRRCRRVDNEILAMYLGGVSTRKVKRIARLLGVTKTLSPTSVSRVVSQLREQFETGHGRSLKDEPRAGGSAGPG